MNTKQVEANKDNTSVLGNTWNFFQNDARDIMHVMQKFDLSDISANLILNRLKTDTNFESYLTPKLKTLLPDPSILLDMDLAVARTVEAILKKQKITVFADYDVDGATSSAVIRRFLNDIAIETALYIPDRIDEGYGASTESLTKISHNGTDLVLMCDCGTTSFEALETAKNLGLDVVVLDHHTAEPKLPDCTALVNPNRLDQMLAKHEDLKYLCAAGVAFLFIVALARKLREHDIASPNLMNYLDLVALGTVCDVMPLKGLNRALVSQGLIVMNQHKNVGLTALAEVAKVADTYTAYHLGFVFGPRINAGGRVGNADYGSLLLTTNDEKQAKKLAMALDFYNQERQFIEKEALNEAIQRIETENLYKNPIIIVAGDNWHPGIIGIVSGRIKEKYQKPTLVISFDDKGIGKGSGRSVPGVDLGPAMHEGVHKALLLKGGGHAMAAGLTLTKNQYDAFYIFMNDRFRDVMAAYVPTMNIDLKLPFNAISMDLIHQIKTLEPFGNGNATPRFCVENARVTFSKVVGENHLSVTLQDDQKNTMKAIAFRACGGPMEAALKVGNICHIAGQVKPNYWNGREYINFIIDDIFTG